jgi:general secretion pathway protein H
MVSIVIIGIILSFATLSIGDGGQSRHLKQQVQQLTALLNLASQTAILQGKEIGVIFTQKNIHFYLWQNQDWRLLSHDDVFYPRAFTIDMQMTLSIEGETVVIDEVACKETSACKPQILLLSSGELTPFELTLTVTSSALVYQLVGTLTSVEYSLKQTESN